MSRGSHFGCVPAAILLIVANLADCSRAVPAGPAYTPRVRDVTITAVPLLSKELEGIYPFLKESLLNPEDDEHSFVVSDLFVRMPGQTRTEATLVATRAGSARSRARFRRTFPRCGGSSSFSRRTRSGRGCPDRADQVG